MPHLVSNLYEKKFTPFTAKLAPSNLWNRPVLGKSINLNLNIYLKFKLIFKQREKQSSRQDLELIQL